MERQDGTCVLEGARQNRTAVVSVELLHHLAPLRKNSFPLSPTELTVEFAQLLVEVTVAGWSRQCLLSWDALSSTSQTRQSPYLPLLVGLQPLSWPTFASKARHGSPRSLPCGKRVNELWWYRSVSLAEKTVITVANEVAAENESTNLSSADWLGLARSGAGWLGDRPDVHFPEAACRVDGAPVPGTGRRRQRAQRLRRARLARSPFSARCGHYMLLWCR